MIIHFWITQLSKNGINSSSLKTVQKKATVQPIILTGVQRFIKKSKEEEVSQRKRFGFINWTLLRNIL